MPWDLSKPVVAAINGHAIGVGITFPLSADVRFVADDAKLQFAFVRRGIAPELGSSKLLTHIVGLQTASDLLLSGRFFSGQEAQRIGLVAQSLPSEQVLPAALAWAHGIAKNTAPVSVAVTKRMMWENIKPEILKTVSQEFSIIPWLGAQPDGTEGVMHFIEKRAPEWQGSVNEDLPDFS